MYRPVARTTLVFGTTCVLACGGQRLRQDQGIGERTTRNQVLLDDSLEYRGTTPTIPSTFRIDDRDWSTFTYTEAIRFGSENAPAPRESQLFEPALEVVPGTQASLLVATSRIGLVATEKNVSLRGVDADRHGHTSLTCATTRFRRWPLHRPSLPTFEEWKQKVERRSIARRQC